MRKITFLFLCLFAAAGCSSMRETELTIDPERAVIAAVAGQEKAAEELKLHLDRITGRTIPLVKAEEIRSGQFVFHVGRSPSGKEGKLLPEEARWEITPDAAYFYGDRESGTLFAVYDFLENELGVRWPSPGDVAFRKQDPIRIKNTSGQWSPRPNIRTIRAGGKGASKDLSVWRGRLRSGGHDQPRYGHAFTQYWKRFGKTRPEFFAMREDGLRGPVSLKKGTDNAAAFQGESGAAVAMCVTCGGLIEQILADWKAAGCPLYINLCENDALGKDSCHCPECRALDVVPEKKTVWENWYADRYVHFANRVLAGAKKIRPDVKAAMYAYNATEQAPSREKPDPDLVIGIVPTDFTMEGIRSYVGSWKKAGLNHFFYRPNRHFYYDLPQLPVGSEKHFFELWQYLWNSGAIGFDYDSPGETSIFQFFGNYVLLKAMQEPDRPFEYWEDHYMQSFGAAKEDILQYYRYWREQVWEKRLAPCQSEIAELGKVFNFGRGLIWNLDRFYRENDFIEAGKHLDSALTRNLTEEERARIEKLKLANEHARLFFNAVAKKTDADSLALVAFRRKHDIPLLPWNEQYYGDVCGIKRVLNFQEYTPPYLKTPLFWHFRLDPDDRGLQEKWYEHSPEQVRGWGAVMCTNTPWETPHKHYAQVSEEIRKQTAGYDGIAWYGTQLKIPRDWKGKKIFLYFEAVDESCWVYINGRETASRLYKNPNDWSTPFALEIGSGIDWERPVQNVIIRVKDTAGQGGIWKPIWLVSKD